MWWNAAESGWGISVVQHSNNVLFAAWYMYDAHGEPLWIVMPGGTWAAQDRYTGTLYQTVGPTSFSTFDPSRVVATSVGTATFEFTANDRAILSYTVNGSTGQKQITRQPF
jgi:hypothetical protein